MKNELDGNEKILKDKIIDLRKNFSNYILSELDDEQNLDFLLRKKRNTLRLKEKMNEINRDIEFNKIERGN